MKKLIALCGLGFALAVSAPVFAGPQQEKMKVCSKEAKDAAMKGDERKAFMKKCLSNHGSKSEAAAPAAPAAPETPAAASSQDRMKGCSADAKAKGLKGDERKSYMSTCLKG